MIYQGTVHKYPDHVNTDVIIPARYLNNTDKDFLAAHCMEDIDPEFTRNVKAGDIIVGGLNFGCGSSREHAPIAIKACQVSCIIAENFARIFFRNCINIGLPVLESPEASRETESGDEIEVDLESGVIKNLTKGKAYQAAPFPEFMRNIIENGGLVNTVKAGLGEK
jgi:3-isopropylmalate/(R)-2-methylmalate dehydratase small subunit